MTHWSTALIRRALLNIPMHFDVRVFNLHKSGGRRPPVSVMPLRASAEFVFIVFTFVLAYIFLQALRTKMCNIRMDFAENCIDLWSIVGNSNEFWWNSRMDFAE